MKKAVKVLSLLGVAGILSGCSSLHKQQPVCSMEMNIGSMPREAYEVLERVEGESTTASLIGGLIKFVDGGKMIFFGMRFFEDQYSLAPMTGAGDLLSRITDLPSTQDRAYFKALAATPDADVIIPKTYDQELRGIPYIFEHETVIFKGKAIKIKSDREMNK